MLIVLASACTDGDSGELGATDSLMAEIFVELHLLQARNSLLVPPSPLNRDSIIAHYGLTPAEFEVRMHFYANHPATYNALQNRITDLLGRESHSVRGY